MLYNFISFRQREAIDKLLQLASTPESLRTLDHSLSGTTGNAHRIVAELIDLGAENTKIYSILKTVHTVGYNC
jgi:phosphoesterase RecJ-like protein